MTEPENQGAENQGAGDHWGSLADLLGAPANKPAPAKSAESKPTEVATPKSEAPPLPREKSPPKVIAKPSGWGSINELLGIPSPPTPAAIEPTRSEAKPPSTIAPSASQPTSPASETAYGSRRSERARGDSGRENEERAGGHRPPPRRDRDDQPRSESPTEQPSREEVLGWLSSEPRTPPPAREPAGSTRDLDDEPLDEFNDAEDTGDESGEGTPRGNREAGESSGDRGKRRRRRRGGRGRNRNAQGRSPSSDEPIAIDPLSGPPFFDPKQSDLKRRRDFDEPPAIDEDEFVESTEIEDIGSNGPGSDSEDSPAPGKGRRRRRRRGSGKNREERRPGSAGSRPEGQRGSGQRSEERRPASQRPAGSRSAGDEELGVSIHTTEEVTEVQVTSHPRGHHAGDVPDIDDDLEDDLDSDPSFGDDEDDDAGLAGERMHKKIPTWEDTVGIVIATNMESRARSPGGGQQRGRGGRGRGGQGRGGRGRGGGGGGGNRGRS